MNRCEHVGTHHTDMSNTINNIMNNVCYILREIAGCMPL